MFYLKKITAFAMLCIIVLPIIFFSLLAIKQKIVQHQMEEMLEEAALQSITVKKTDFIWVKPKKEISINGKLFDVKSITIKNEVTIFTGLYDTQEDDIKNKLAHLFQNKKSANNSNSFNFLKLIQTPSLIFYNYFNIVTTASASTLYYVFYNENNIPFSLDVPTPPPLV